LSGVVAGNYTVKLNSDQPIVAAASTTTAGSAAADFAWFSAAAPQDGDFLVSVAGGPSPALHLANTSGTDTDLTITSTTGPAIDVSVAAGQSVVVALAGSETHLVTGGTGIAASVGYTGDGQSASFTLSPIGPLAAAIPVYSH